ncbi:HAD family hydrolase [Salsuginibacillus kocurii]|uniref:HAD family hydrolase n=1 Tax=Salsuginibacillus kocurii TaxID=427078 RepID=UPI00036F264E|nr:HAD family hydrolase [Salsuginibacillus kocurii]
MTIIWDKIKLVIFDLDGTLYEDTAHFEYYANQLSDKLPEEKRESFWKDYRNMLKGNHPVIVGRVYDAVRDRILVVSPETNQVTRIFNWDGQELDEFEKYPAPITMDFDNFIAIGDGWWPPVAAAKHYGVGSTYDAYSRTKDFMQTEEFQFADNPGLREALTHLGKKKDLVLITNSQADDVERLLVTLNLSGVFPQIVASAKKPQQTLHHFETLLDQYGINPEEAVSIGDNYLNEIAPAERLGMQAVLIDSANAFEAEKESTMVVQTLSELFAEMKSV